MSSTPPTTAGSRPRGMLVMRDGLAADLFDAEHRRALDDLLDLVSPTSTAVLDHPRLDEVEVLITGWGCPRIGAGELDRMPSLRVIHHAAGTVKEHLDPEVWRRGIVVTSAAAANAIPVAEYTLAMILLAGKAAPSLAAAYRDDPAADFGPALAAIGNHRRRIGILGASKVGRRVLELLRGFDLDLAVSDPHLGEDDPVRGSAQVMELDELFAWSDVVSIHAPLLPETIGLVGRRQLALLRDGATLVNTARGAIVDHDALLDEARSGRLHAILDVTDPEPLPVGHPLLSLPTVVLTPHIAGALGNELHRLGAAVVAEVRRRAAGEAPLQAVPLEALAAMA
ncbi:hydroxyacid dehydrogenase [Microbacterium maritypicum]